MILEFAWSKDDTWEKGILFFLHTVQIRKGYMSFNTLSLEKNY